MVDEPTVGELMRRLEDAIRQMADLARKLDEDRAAVAQTYVRQDVYLAQRRADHAIVSDLAGDVKALDSKINATEDKRRSNVRWAVGVAISIAAVMVAVLGLLLNQGGPL